MKWTPYLAGILPFGELFKGGKLFWWLLCTAGVIFCIYRTVGCFLEIRRRLPARILLMAGCMVTGMMIIYLADMDNLPPAMAVFLAAVWLGCGGSPMKRITIGLIISCTVFTYNALIDNYLLYGLRHDTGTAAEILSGFLRLAFSGVLYICARYFSPKHKDFELSRACGGSCCCLLPRLWGSFFVSCCYPDTERSAMTFRIWPFWACRFFLLPGFWEQRRSWRARKSWKKNRTSSG